MCTSPIEIHRKSAVNGRVYSRIVPCGKCSECLNQKQNDNAVLSYLEACKRGKLTFCTLTYNNDTFPVRERVGIMYSDDNIEWQTSGFVSDERAVELRRIFVDAVREDFSKVIRSEVFTDSSGKKLVSEFGASLRRNDFREYMKRERIAFERRHGSKLPDFSFMVVGEYGEQNHRPHFHVCFYGLEESVVRELLDHWSERYGFIDVKTVVRWTSDAQHDGFFAASRYLGKYLTKGEMDSYNVKCGLAEKSRVLRSIGFGVPSRRELASLLSFTLWKIMQEIHNVEKTELMKLLNVNTLL